jgi:hypothetical protein
VNEAVRDPRGRWMTGNPERPVGSRNRLATEVLDAFLADFRVHGAAALVRVREDSALQTEEQAHDNEANTKD